jgi:hypothetical protein
MSIKKLQDTPPARRRGIRLKTLRDVRRLLNKTINELRNGDADIQVSRAIIYACSVCLTCFETEKLEAIEARLALLEVETDGEELPEYNEAYSRN